MKKQLRYFQQEACKGLHTAMEEGKNPYASLFTGLGKSLVLAALTNRYQKQNARVLQLVPRLELVNQNYNEAVEYCDHPESIGIVCGQMGLKEKHKQVVIAMASSFVNIRGSSGQFDYVLVDECFSGDTLISTISGNKRIDSLRCGDIVYNSIGTGFVEKISIKPIIETYILEFDDESKIECTKDHPFFTERGWKEAKYLEKGDYFFSIKGLSCLYDKFQALDKREGRESSELLLKKSMGKAEILQRILCEEISEPNEQSSNTLKDDSEIKGNKTQTYKTWWQRAIVTFASISSSSCPWGGMGVGSICENEQRVLEWCLSELLQNRHSEQGINDRNRVRRWKPLLNREEAERFEKIKSACFPRLVNISIIKRESAIPVFNISVSGHPSYFANGKLVHNCHRLRFKDKDNGIYQKIVEALNYHNTNLKVCGVTATPYRLDQGELHHESWKTKPFFTDKVYDTAQEPGLKRLIDEGYLSHIETLNSTVRVDLTGVKKSGEDYNQTEAGVKFDAIIDNAVEDMRQHFADNNIKTAVIFASSIANAKHILNAWQDETTMRIVSGESSKKERSDALEWLKNGFGCRHIVNVNLLTEGFDYKALECVVLLRATTSPGLLIQMVGRVIRPHDDKQHGYLIDYGTNIERLTHGGIENIIIPVVNPKQEKALTKKCLAVNDGVYCGEQNNLSAKRCKKCGAEFISESEDGNYSMRTKAEALIAKQEETFTYDVYHVEFEHYQKNDTPMIKMVFSGENFEHLHNEYLCLEHQGSAKGLAIAKVQSLLKNKRDYYQISKFENGVCVKSVLFLLQNHYEQFFKKITRITLQKDGRFNKLISWEF